MNYKLNIFAFALVLFGSSVSSYATWTVPTITHSINGLDTTISWTIVPGATEYKLSYAPIPYTGPESIRTLNLGGATSFSAVLWEGAAFYVAVQAGDGLQFSEYSNIDSITITSLPPSYLTGGWLITETQGPNNCDFNVGEIMEYPIVILQSGNSINAEGLFLGPPRLSGNLVGNTATLIGNEELIEYSYSSKLTLNFSVLPGNTLSGSFKWEINSNEGNCISNSSMTGICTTPSCR